MGAHHRTSLAHRIAELVGAFLDVCLVVLTIVSLLALGCMMVLALYSLLTGEPLP